MTYTFRDVIIYGFDITTFDGYILRIDCNAEEDGLRTTPCSQCVLDALAIDRTSIIR